MKNLQIVENSNEQKLHNYSNNKVLEFLKTNMYLGIKGEINYRLSSNDSFILFLISTCCSLSSKFKSGKDIISIIFKVACSISF